MPENNNNEPGGWCALSGFGWFMLGLGVMAAIAFLMTAAGS